MRFEDKQLHRYRPHTITGTVGFGFLLLQALFNSACSRQEMPKPYAYARLEYPSVPHKTFHSTGNSCWYEYPGCFTIYEKPSGKPNVHWVDLRWSDYGVTLYTTYSQTDNPTTIKQQVGNTVQLLQEKIPTLSTINQRLAFSSDSSLTAYLFEVDGPCSIPMEFLITDGKQHLFNAVLQFDKVPDRDSLADILDGLNKDMLHLIESFTFTPTP